MNVKGCSIVLVNSALPLHEEVRLFTQALHHSASTSPSDGVLAVSYTHLTLPTILLV